VATGTFVAVEVGMFVGVAVGIFVAVEVAVAGLVIVGKMIDTGVNVTVAVARGVRVA
jgi:hypothetical protein